MKEAVAKLNILLNRDHKHSLFFLLIMTITLSMIETIGISAIMPFINIAANPDVLSDGYYKLLYDFFDFQNSSSFLITFGLVLIGFYIFRALYNIYYWYRINSFSFGMYQFFGNRLFQSYLSMPYKTFVNKNSAVLTKNIMTEAQNLSALIQHGLTFVSELFTILFLYTLLLLVDWQMTLVLSLVLGVKVLFLTKILSKIVKKEGQNRSYIQGKFIQLITETFGNFKLIKLYGNESEVYKSLAEMNQKYIHSSIIYGTINQIPRGVLETLGFSLLIGIVLYILYGYDDASFVIPIISMYAIALYRILPAVNRIMISYNGIVFLQKSLDIVHKDLTMEIPKEGNQPINFEQNIVFQNVSFEHKDTIKILQSVSLTICKGDRVAFIGESVIKHADGSLWVFTCLCQ